MRLINNDDNKEELLVSSALKSYATVAQEKDSELNPDGRQLLFHSRSVISSVLTTDDKSCRTDTYWDRWRLIILCFAVVVAHILEKAGSMPRDLLADFYTLFIRFFA